MKKVPTIFERDWTGDRSRVIDRPVPEAQWVFDGEGVATEKWDGTPVKLEGGIWYKRYDAKKGRTPPEGFVPAQDPDPVTGHWPGWLKVGDGPEDKWLRESIAWGAREFEDSYEAIGPKIQGNPYGLTEHQLRRHAHHEINPEPARTFEALRNWLAGHKVEGIVWHRSNGDMAKIKRRDFGLPWPVRP